MDLLAQETGGKSYKAHKYSLDHAERPEIDYGEDGAVWEEIAETNPKKTYTGLAKFSRGLSSSHVKSCLSYFLDGSRRVYKVDDIAYTKSGGRTAIYPVLAGQIGVGCCKRENGHLKEALFKAEMDLSLPEIADADGYPGFFDALAKKINKADELVRRGLKFAKVIPYRVDQKGARDKKFEDRGTARIQDRMIELEKDAVAELVRRDKLGQDDYLIKDGSLEYRSTKRERISEREKQIFLNNYKWVVGVSKNFNPQICKDTNGKANPGFIANLPLYARTPVALYRWDNMKYAVWYVRIRAKERTRTPFDGIVKMEKLLVTDEEQNRGIESQEADFLSAQLINERMPTCYGSDLRWANHIYPIYLTEKYVKSHYLGTESFLHLF